MINIKRVKISLAVFAGLIVYYFIVRLTGLSVPCLFHLITKLKCPGCGITGLCVNLLSLNFKDAFMSHPFIFATLPYLAYIMLKAYLDYIICEPEMRVNSPRKSSPDFIKVRLPLNINYRFSKIDNISMYIYTAALIIFTIIRNIKGF